MKTIHKQPLLGPGNIRIPFSKVYDLPAGAEVIHVGYQQGWLCVWYEVPLDPETGKPLPKQPRCFEVHPTGLSELYDNAKHLGTVMEGDGALVWHVYERNGR